MSFRPSSDQQYQKKDPYEEQDQQPLIPKRQAGGVGANYIYADVFPAERRRTNQKEIRDIQMGGGICDKVNWPACCFSFGFCLLLSLIVLIPLATWTAYKLFTKIMTDMYYPSPYWIWIIIIICTVLVACLGLPGMFTRSQGTGKKLTVYGGSAIGCFLFILMLWCCLTAPFAGPFLARAGNEICQDFLKASTRPSVCGAVPTSRLLYANTSRALYDIDLDEDGWGSDLLSSEPRRLDPAHDGAQSYLTKLFAGGSYCVDTSKHEQAWVAPTYDRKAHDAAVTYKKTITTKAICDETTELCKTGSPAVAAWDDNTACTCNGDTVTVNSKVVGGSCNLWSFGDAEAWCLVNSGAKNCGTLVAYNGKVKSTAPCLSGMFGNLVTMRSKALMTGLIQYIMVLLLALVVSCFSCSMAGASYFLFKLPKEKRYHVDNGLPWADLEESKPENAEMWRILGWNQINWDASNPAIYPRSENKTWAQLSRRAVPPFENSEQQAAVFLGFSKDSWDGETMIEAHKLATRGGDAINEDMVNAELADQFYAWQEEASKRIKDETPELKRLELYGFYHQATQGNVTGMRPAVSSKSDEMDQKKYDAWYRLQSMDRSVAMKKYIEAVKALPFAPGAKAPNWKAKP